MTQLNVPGATMLPCGNYVAKTTPTGRKQLRPLLAPDTFTAARLICLGFFISK